MTEIGMNYKVIKTLEILKIECDGSNDKVVMKGFSKIIPISFLIVLFGGLIVNPSKLLELLVICILIFVPLEILVLIYYQYVKDLIFLYEFEKKSEQLTVIKLRPEYKLEKLIAIYDIKNIILGRDFTTYFIALLIRGGEKLKLYEGVKDNCLKLGGIISTYLEIPFIYKAYYRGTVIMVLISNIIIDIISYLLLESLGRFWFGFAISLIPFAASIYLDGFLIYDYNRYKREEEGEKFIKKERKKIGKCYYCDIEFINLCSWCRVKLCQNHSIFIKTMLDDQTRVYCKQCYKNRIFFFMFSFGLCSLPCVIFLIFFPSIVMIIVSCSLILVFGLSVRIFWGKNQSKKYQGSYD